MSDWWDPTSWAFFSDWGAASWSEDIEAAVSQAEDWIERVAIARTWPADTLNSAIANVEYSGRNSDDARGFWSELVKAWDGSAVSAKSSTGWDQLRDTFVSAAQAAGSTAEGREQGSLGTVAAGTIEASAEDVVDMAEFAKKWGPWIALVLVIIGVVAFAATRK